MTRLTPLLALFLVSGFAPAQADNKCATAQQDTIRNFIFRVIPSISDLTQNWGHVSAWSKGGGSRLTIDSNSPVFAGRQYGGGKRKEIYGTRAYGSGYPYGADNPNTVAGRPFPFGAWPISFGDYMGGSEYGGESVEIQRPGGPLAVARVGGGSNPDEVYQIIGDRDSVVFMMADLVNWCHVTPSWPTTFNPSAPDAPKPQNIIQYYRASSFALSYAYYTNTFALPSSNPQTSFSMQQSTPIPSNITNSPFLSCVVNTIGDAVPIMDGYKKPLSKGAIAGIVIGSIAGFLILVCACTWLDSSDGKKGKAKAAKEPAPGTPTEADALKMEDVNKDIHTQNQESLPYKEDNQKASQEQTTATQPAQTDASSHTGVRKDEPKEVDINDLGAQPGVKEVDVKDLA